jgi:hypothetical protein
MSFHDRPTAAELLDAVRAYLTNEVAATDDRRARFRALIAANVLAIAAREVDGVAGDEALEERLFEALEMRDGTLDDRRWELARAIRAGDFDSPGKRDHAMEYARETVLRKLAVANPKFLAAIT